MTIVFALLTGATINSGIGNVKATVLVPLVLVQPLGDLSIDDKVEEDYIENINLIDVSVFAFSSYVCMLKMQIQGDRINDRFHRQVTCGH